MEKRVNSMIEQYIQTFKQDVCNKVNEIQFDNSSQQAELLGFIYDYDRLCMGKEDFVKRKRIKNAIPTSNRCTAKRANGEQCTRRRKDSLEFCGKHNKNLKFGRIDDKTKYSDNNEFLKTKEIKIDGKNYLINDKNIVFNYDMNNPMIIGKLDSEGKIITIDQMNLNI